MVSKQKHLFLSFWLQSSPPPSLRCSWPLRAQGTKAKPKVACEIWWGFVIRWSLCFPLARRQNGGFKPRNQKAYRLAKWEAAAVTSCCFSSFVAQPTPSSLCVERNGSALHLKCCWKQTVHKTCRRVVKKRFVQNNNMSWVSRDVGVDYNLMGIILWKKVTFMTIFFFVLSYLCLLKWINGAYYMWLPPSSWRQR